MVSLDQVTNGIMVYIRDYLLGQIPKDNYKYVLGNVALELLGAGIIKNKQEFSGKLMEFLSNSPFAPFVMFINPEGMVDIEAIRAVVPKYVQPDGFKVRIPMIATFSILPNDIDVIYNCIVNSPPMQIGINGGVK